MLTKTFLYREIHEQPSVVGQFLEREWPIVQELVLAMRQQEIDQVIVAARGTSDNAARYAKYVLGAYGNLSVALAAPSLFTLYGRMPRFGRALVLGISQSGRSPDIVAVLAEARRQGRLTAVITNKPDSPLARQGDFVIDLHAGQERAVAATKSYTASLAAIALLGAALGNGSDVGGVLRRDLESIADSMTEALKLEPIVTAAAPRYRFMTHSVVIGRGFNYATAFELALKLKELTYTIAEPYSSADFLHGPLAMIEHGFPAVVLAVSGVLSGEMADFVKTLRRLGAEVLVIGDEQAALRVANVAFKLPSLTAEWLSPLVTVIPGQLLALHLAHERGYDVDAPRVIHKVTETR